MKTTLPPCHIERDCIDRHEGNTTLKIQPFPITGSLGGNRNKLKSELLRLIRDPDTPAYSYIVTTVKIVNACGADEDSKRFEQFGSGPNFQGDRLTLCTCKHQMRASRSANDWQNVWVAGFTSRSSFGGKHWLVYLAQIQRGYESHCSLWNSLTKETRHSKAADENYLGDVFKPKDSNVSGRSQFLPSHYVVPEVHVHRQKPGHRGWRNDISYRHSKRFGDPALLVAKPRKTFLWDKPLIHFAENHCRNYRKWQSVEELLGLLCEAPR